jgi:hypothetical protein
MLRTEDTSSADVYFVQNIYIPIYILRSRILALDRKRDTNQYSTVTCRSFEAVSPSIWLVIW